MAINEDILVRLRAVGQAAFTGAMNEAAGSIGKIAPAAQKADTAVSKSGTTAGRQTGKWRSMAGGLAKVAGGAAALYAAKRGITGAISSTEELGKATLAITRNTGLDARQASAWAEITRVRDIDSKRFGISLVALSRQMTAANSGTKNSVKLFKDLGVSQDMLRRGDTQGVIMRVADAFERTKNPAERAAQAQKLFGRQGQALLPLLTSGSAGLREQLGLADKYGATMGGKTVGAIKENIARQRELKIAQDGLKTSLGLALLPVMESFTKITLAVVQALQPLLRNADLLKVLLGAVAVAMIAYKVATIASTIATLGFNAAFLLIPLAIIAIGAALVYAYLKVGWFRRAVNAVFNFIKKNWPLLVAILAGPIGIAVLLIIKNFRKIRGVVSAVIGWFKRLPGAISSIFNSVVGAIGRFLGKLPGTASRAFHGMVNAARRIVSGFTDIGKDIITAIVNGIKSAPGAILGALKGSMPGKLADKVGGALGLWQHGGVVPHAQWGIVGEAGPELLQLPGGSRITPLPSPRAAGGATLGVAGAAGSMQTTAHFYLDRRLIATAVAQDTADRKARR